VNDCALPCSGGSQSSACTTCFAMTCGAAQTACTGPVPSG
jgi:hypothetical protein